jgi:hypothetical protein
MPTTFRTAYPETAWDPSQRSTVLLLDGSRIRGPGYAPRWQVFAAGITHVGALA